MTGSDEQRPAPPVCWCGRPDDDPWHQIEEPLVVERVQHSRAPAAESLPIGTDSTKEEMFKSYWRVFEAGAEWARAEDAQRFVVASLETVVDLQADRARLEAELAEERAARASLEAALSEACKVLEPFTSEMSDPEFGASVIAEWRALAEAGE